LLRCARNDAAKTTKKLVYWKIKEINVNKVSLKILKFFIILLSINNIFAMGLDPYEALNADYVLMFEDAVENNQLDIVESVLEKKLAEGDVRFGCLGHATLMSASRDGDLDLIKVLLKCGIDVNKKDGKHNTALMIAARQGHTAIVKYLLENHAIFIKEALGNASLGKNIATIEILMKEYYKQYFESKSILNLLLSDAILFQIPEMVKYWLSQGAEYDVSIGEILHEFENYNYKNIQYGVLLKIFLPCQELDSSWNLLKLAKHMLDTNKTFLPRQKFDFDTAKQIVAILKDARDRKLAGIKQVKYYAIHKELSSKKAEQEEDVIIPKRQKIKASRLRLENLTSSFYHEVLESDWQSALLKHMAEQRAMGAGQ